MHLPWNKFMRLYNDSNNLFTCKRILIGSIHVLRGAYVLPIATSRAFSELAGWPEKLRLTFYILSVKVVNSSLFRKSTN